MPSDPSVALDDVQLKLATGVVERGVLVFFCHRNESLRR